MSVSGRSEFELAAGLASKLRCILMQFKPRKNRYQNGNANNRENRFGFMAASKRLGEIKAIQDLLTLQDSETIIKTFQKALKHPFHGKQIAWEGISYIKEHWNVVSEEIEDVV